MERYESIAWPDFFAAYLFVGSQWDTAQLSGPFDYAYKLEAVRDWLFEQSR